jgi:hypothetical protein
MLPEEVCQVTVLSDVEPATVAENEIVPPVVVDTVAGDTVTEVTEGPPGDVGAAVTVTVATPVILPSASLVAVTMEVPGVVGAV